MSLFLDLQIVDSTGLDRFLELESSVLTASFARTLARDRFDVACLLVSLSFGKSKAYI